MKHSENPIFGSLGVHLPAPEQLVQNLLPGFGWYNPSLHGTTVGFPLHLYPAGHGSHECDGTFPSVCRPEKHDLHVLDAAGLHDVVLVIGHSSAGCHPPSHLLPAGHALHSVPSRKYPGLQEQFVPLLSVIPLFPQKKHSVCPAAGWYVCGKQGTHCSTASVSGLNDPGGHARQLPPTDLVQYAP